MTNKKQFQEQGYCLVESAISTELRDFITQYCLFDEMRNDSDKDWMVPDAHGKYADPAMESLLVLLQDKMEEATGLKLFPTYSYFRVYRNGNILDPHIDRPACEISTTLCFNYDYNDKDYQWPIFMGGNPLLLKPGDMAVYRGCDIEHWRERFNPPGDHWHVQGFFHYVDANGPFKDIKYDERPSLGMHITTKERKKSLNSEFPYIQYVD